MTALILISTVYRTQAHAAEIESLAKKRLADEYDAAQERGEVAKHGDTLKRGPDVPNGNVGKATAADLGFRNRKDIHEARQIRDAENEDPGIVKRTLNNCIANGKEPSKAAVKQAVEGAAKRAKLKRTDAEAMAARAKQGEPLASIGKDYGMSGRSVSGTINSLTASPIAVPEGTTVESQVRKGMGLESEGLSAENAAKEIGIGDHTYRRVREIIILLDEIDLTPPDRQIVVGVLDAINAMRQIASHDAAEPIIRRVWGANPKNHRTVKTARKRVDHFATVAGIAVQSCANLTLDEFEIPYLSEDETRRWVKELESARRSLDVFLKQLKGVDLVRSPQRDAAQFEAATA